MLKSDRCVGFVGYVQEPVWKLTASPVNNPLSKPEYEHWNGIPSILVKEYPF